MNKNSFTELTQQELSTVNGGWKFWGEEVQTSEECDENDILVTTTVIAKYRFGIKVGETPWSEGLDG